MRTVLSVFGACALLGHATWSSAQTVAGDTAAHSRIEAAARRIAAAAVYATFVTLDNTGRPRTRQVEPQLPDSAWTVWFATNPKTRKVADIARDGRVVLHYFDPTLSCYTSLSGRARAVRDRATKDAHWAPAWSSYYPDRDTSVVLIAVHAERLEVVCPKLGIDGDKGTWLPPSVRLPRR